MLRDRSSMLGNSKTILPGGRGGLKQDPVLKLIISSAVLLKNVEKSLCLEDKCI